jgi:tRNA(fMet)-specific endonuclease VapC
LAVLTNSRSKEPLVARYALFQRLFKDLSRFEILPYDNDADGEFQRIPRNVRQHHPTDCKIAAIALARGMVIVARNLNHFSRIPRLLCEDWT